MENKKFKINKGIFVFLNKQNLTFSSMRKVLIAFATSKGIEIPQNRSNQWFSEISDQAQNNFKDFKQVFNSTPSLKYKNQSSDYNDWYDQCNSDGSFAYNGVADDF